MSLSSSGNGALVSLGLIFKFIVALEHYATWIPISVSLNLIAIGTFVLSFFDPALVALFELGEETKPNLKLSSSLSSSSS